MSTEKDLQDPAAPPTAMTAEMRATLSILFNRLDRAPDGGPSTFRKQDAPDPATRRKLQEHLDMLLDKLQPADQSEPGSLRIKRELRDFMKEYPVLYQCTPEELVVRHSRYYDAVKDLPEWATLAALRKIRDGHTDARWVPNAPELRLLARPEVLRFERDKEDLKRILTAIVLDDGPETLEERASNVDRYWTHGARKSVSSVEMSAAELVERRQRKLKEFEDDARKFVGRERKAYGLPERGPTIAVLRKIAAISQDYGAPPDEDESAQRG